MKFAINPERMGSSFSVSNEIVDKHLRIASGEQIKVLLLILRKGADKLDENKIAKALKYDVSDVEDYLQYWINTGILTESEPEQTAEKEQTPQEPVKYVPGAAAQSAKAAQETKPAPTTPEYSMPSSSEIAIRIGESAELRTLFNEAQVKLGKTIGYDGQCTLILLHDHYGLPIDVIYMLVDYCVSIGKSGFSYIQAAGKSWSEQEIDTIDKAAEKISSLNSVSSLWRQFSSAAGISNPRPTTAQSAKLEGWLKLGMDLDMIIYAYEIMSENTGKLSFSYMDKVIEGWVKNGYKSVDDVKNAEKARKDASAKPSNQNSQSGASYDLGKFTENSIKGKLEYKRKDRK